MLGRRVDYPGWRAPGTPPATGYDPNRYQAFALDKHLDLSYHNAYVNPDTDQAAAGGVDTLDRRLHNQGALDAIYRSSLNWADNVNNRFRFLPADKWQYWAAWNFTYDPTVRTNVWSAVVQPQDGPLPAIPTNIRSLLTTYNGVSNTIVKHSIADADVGHSAMLPYAAKGRWELGYSNTVGYKQGDIVIHSYRPFGAGTVGITEPFLCVADYQGTGEPQAVAASWVRLQGRGEWNPPATAIGGAYVRGNVVTYENPATAGVDGDLYICIAASTGSAPTDTSSWYKVPAGAVPAKVSLNTAPFAELFRGFWNVMKSDFPAQHTHFDGDITAARNSGAYEMLDDPRGGTAYPATFNDPYVGNKFMDYWNVGGAGGPAPFDPDLRDFTGPGAGPPSHPARMFRSPIRAVADMGGLFSAQTPRLPADQVMLLRAAIAAVNAEDLRDADADITAREIILQAVVDTGGDGTATLPADMIPVSCVVYGHEPQPYITEVYANTDNVRDFGSGTNPNGYIAIELYNPYPVPINMTNWVIAACPRRAQAGYPADTDRDMTVLADFGVAGDAAESYPSTTGTLGEIPLLTIPANGYMILENHPSSVAPIAAGSAASRPPSAGIIGTTRTSGPIQVPVGTPVVTVFVPGLGDNGGATALRTATDNELVILRPRRSDGTYSYYTSAGVSDGRSVPYPSRIGFDERPLSNPNFWRDMVPVDSFDFTNLVLPGTLSSNAYCWHYVRRSDAASGGAFHFVYPGRYNAGNPAPTPRQAGTQYTNFWTAGDPLNDPWDPTIGGFPPGHPEQPPPNPPNPMGPSMSFGTTFIDGSPDYTQPVTVAVFSNLRSSLGSMQVSRPIQLSNYHFDASGTIPGGGSSVGHNLLYEGLPVAFPFGGFMRNGDVMHVPFIGAYRILDPTDRLNAGGTLLEINPVTMDAAMAEDTEVGNDGLVTLGGPTEYVEQVGRFCPPWTQTMAQLGGLGYSYAWASDLLDQFTAIQNFHDDFLPNADPARYPSAAPTPTPVANLIGARPNTLADRNAPAQGLINVNTAPAEVLATVPMVIDSATGAPNVAENLRLAQAIVYYRDVDAGGGTGPHGPFKSLFELNAVVETGGANGFYNMMGQYAPGTDAKDTQGDFTPRTGFLTGTQTDDDGVALDYEQRYLNVMRLSNLLTTRSDVFKAYVLVQGWKNTGTEHPQLVAERRASFIIDRSKTASDNTTLNVLTVPSR
jgi:hypothetical protein